MVYDVVVVGGGLSGMATAAKLAQNKISVLLIEKNNYLGGRAFSFKEGKTNLVIDNGQHLMLGCYTNTFNFLKLINPNYKLVIPNKLEIVFYLRNIKYVFKTINIFAPLNFVSALLKFKLISFKNKLNICKILFALFRNEKNISSYTITEWLNKHSQPENIQQKFWNVIAIGALNDLPNKASAELFKNILKIIMLGSSKNSSFVIPKENLSELFADNFDAYASNNNYLKIITNNRVENIQIEKNELFSLKINNSKTIKSKKLVFATQNDAFFKILENSNIDISIVNKGLKRFSYSQILNVHLWFDREFMSEKFVAMLDSNIHWIFNKSDYSKSKFFYLTVVISGAKEIISKSNSEILKIILKEINKSFPNSLNSKLIHSKIIKEKKATFIQSPENQIYRPDNITKQKGLFIAGDWTDTKLPATIEGAILSGFKTADIIINQFAIGK